MTASKRRATPKDLLYVSKATKDQIDTLASGASLVSRTGYAIKQLQLKAASDRLDLARALLREAAALKSNGSLNRSVVSRAYYAMYHAVRAATFIGHGGDDHEKHTVLPSKIPADFPENARWQNDLKNARYERNRADYDPYPREDGAFEVQANDLLVSASELILATRQYIRSKGLGL